MIQLTRRSFLKNSSLALGIPSLASLSETIIAKGSSIAKRAIPSTGEEIPVVGLGTWQQFDVEPDSPETKTLAEVLKNLLDKGGRVIDSSPMYGRSESVIGQLTQAGKNADSYFYATKVWTRGREEGIRQMEESMRKMNRQKIDLMQVHNLLDKDIHFKTLRKWKEEGKIRYTGATHYATSAHDELEKLIEMERIDFLQFNYNIRERNAEKGLLQKAMDKGVGVIINEPFASGDLFRASRGKALPEWAGEWGIDSWAQFFLKYILSHPAVTCVIPGTSNPKHVIDNTGAGYGKMPDLAGRKKMALFFDAM